MCQSSYAAGLTSTSTTRTRGSSSRAASHRGSTSTWLVAVVSSAVVMRTSPRSDVFGPFYGGVIVTTLRSRWRNLGVPLGGGSGSGAGASGGSGRSEQLFVELAGGRARRDAELIAQAFAEVPVDVECLGEVVLRGECPHQVPVATLPQRCESGELPSGPDRAGGLGAAEADPGGR